MGIYTPIFQNLRMLIAQDVVFAFEHLENAQPSSLHTIHAVVTRYLAAMDLAVLPVGTSVLLS